MSTVESFSDAQNYRFFKSRQQKENPGAVVVTEPHPHCRYDGDHVGFFVSDSSCDAMQCMDVVIAEFSKLRVAHHYFVDRWRSRVFPTPLTANGSVQTERQVSLLDSGLFQPDCPSTRHGSRTTNYETNRSVLSLFVSLKVHTSPPSGHGTACLLPSAHTRTFQSRCC